MKKILVVLLTIITVFSVTAFTGCGSSDKVINVCASETPHADVLNNCVKDILKEQGYTLKVTVLDWTMQNDSVAQKDYDANYFQHVPYLETYSGSTKLFAACKVHYEPLGLYKGKASDFNVEEILKSENDITFIICDDVSNGIRAFQLLEAKGIINSEEEGENKPYTEENDDLKFNFNGQEWRSSVSKVVVKLISEEVLVSSMADYDYALLPCNTAYTGKVDDSKKVAKEDDPEQVSLKANIIAARLDDYNNDPTYKAKIDALCDAMLSEEVSKYFYDKYLGAMTCDASSQIDLRK